MALLGNSLAPRTPPVSLCHLQALQLELTWDTFEPFAAWILNAMSSHFCRTGLCKSRISVFICNAAESSLNPPFVQNQIKDALAHSSVNGRQWCSPVWSHLWYKNGAISVYCNIGMEAVWAEWVTAAFKEHLVIYNVPPWTVRWSPRNWNMSTSLSLAQLRWPLMDWEVAD